MVVVVLTAGGAMLALRAYNSTKQSSPERLTQVLGAVKQQAGVMAAICGAIFTVISALEGAYKPSGVSSGESTGLHGTIFGKRMSERAA